MCFCCVADAGARLICRVLTLCFAVQAAYEDADSTAMALQAVAPIGLKRLESHKLVLQQTALLLQEQLQLN